ncbi:hypothetical protein [Arthrobacter sp. M4]|uniref:hypothetical protein n=1 Tax=Arthrobacter sp. M4 TaxID=218160 RepID=UPI001CDB5C68|nr:hypothetical protein [Arthrobacter sp. M4]MCA4132455.1 hypothetical protein [Arthrobacter sp. M4]
MTDLSTPPAGQEAARQGRRPDGPNAGILAIVTLGLSIASVIVPLLLSGAPYPAPASSPDVVARYFFDHAFPATLNGFLAFGASVPIGIYGATTYARLLRLGVRVPGPGIGFFGAIAASLTLAVAGLLIWTLGQAATNTPATVVHLIANLAFGLGGIGFATGIGLLIAGIAVPSLILGLTPRWMAWAGLVLAALGELSFLGLLWPAAVYVLPVVRFVGLAWLAVVGFTLPRNRHEVPSRPQQRPNP